MFYKNGVLLDLFLYSTFLAFMKSIVKVFFISYIRPDVKIKSVINILVKRRIK
jgi:hypothetical protein